MQPPPGEPAPAQPGAAAGAEATWSADAGWDANATDGADVGMESAEPTEGAEQRNAWRASTMREGNTIRASTGLLHVVQAGSGAPGTFRVSLTGTYFSATGFLCNSDTPCPVFGNESPTEQDEVDRVGAHLGISATPWPFLEAYLGFHNHATSDNRSRPTLLQVLGDTNLGIKAFMPYKPDRIFGLGGSLDLFLLNGTGGVGIDGGGTSFALRGLASLNLDNRLEQEKVIPLRFHFNLGYLFDNSYAVVEELETTEPPEGRGENISRIERFGLDINRTDFFEIGLAGEYVHPVIRPFIEWSIDVPVNRRDYVCNVNQAEARGDLCLGENQRFSIAPSRFTLGARLFPWKGRGLSLLGAVDIGTGATSEFVDEVAPEPPWNLYFGFGYAVDTVPPEPVVKKVEVPSTTPAAVAVEADQYVRGVVVEKGTTNPIPNAVVKFEGRQMPGMLTGDDGAFTTVDLAPGTYTFSISAPGFREGQCIATVPLPGAAAPQPPAAAPAPGAAPGAAPAPGQPPAASGGWGAQPGAQPGAPVPPGPGAPPPSAGVGGKPADIVVQTQCELEPMPKVGNVAGSLLDSATQAPVPGARVIITDRLNRSLELTADQAGAFRFENVPPGTVKITVDAPGYLPSVNEFTIKPREDVPARIMLNKRPTQASVVVTPKELKLKRQVHFLKDMATIEPDSMSIIEEIADTLKTHPEIRGIEIQGHTDNQGTPVYNLRLSQNRAQAVLDALVKLGVEPSRLEAKGYGQDKPLLPNTNEPNRAKNRRVQLIIKGK